jgi:hypothetical protein
MEVSFCDPGRIGDRNSAAAIEVFGKLCQPEESMDFPKIRQMFRHRAAGEDRHFVDTPPPYEHNVNIFCICANIAQSNRGYYE